jgi:peptide/nickel transport system substrate-binding protein
MTTIGPRRGGMLREGYDNDFSILDPAVGAHVDPSWGAIFETPTLADSAGVVGPMLSSGWRQIDPLTWRFDIRAGARFHSGAVCDAAAVAAAHNSHRDPSMPLGNTFYWKPVADVRAEADAVIIELERPWAGLPRNLRSWHSAVHNEALRASSGDAWGRTIVDGTGPFVHQSTVRGVAQEVRRWDEFPGTSARWFQNQGVANLDGVRWIPFLDATERARALEEGEIDTMQNPDFFDVERLQANPELSVVEYQQSSLAYLGVNHRTPPFDDVRVRRALSFAIDREAIVATDLSGHGSAAYGLVPSDSHWFYAETNRYNQYDPRGAEALLDEAGLPRNPSGIRLTFTTPVVQDTTLRRAAVSVQRMLANVGVRLELEYLDEFEPFYELLDTHPPAYICKWLWPDPIDATVGYVWSECHDGGPNWQQAAIPEVDRQCERFFSAENEAEERDASERLQLAAADHLPLIPLYFPSTVWVSHKRVHGWHPTPTNLYPFYSDVWLDQDA